jgi:transcriptional regulator of acetoin/glycerol metabolism
MSHKSTLREHCERAERDYIEEALTDCDGNVTHAATALGIDRTNLHKKLRAHRIRVHRLVVEMVVEEVEQP